MKLLNKGWSVHIPGLQSLFECFVYQIQEEEDDYLVVDMLRHSSDVGSLGLRFINPAHSGSLNYPSLRALTSEIALNSSFEDLLIARFNYNERSSKYIKPKST